MRIGVYLILLSFFSCKPYLNQSSIVEFKINKDLYLKEIITKPTPIVTPTVTPTPNISENLKKYSLNGKINYTALGDSISYGTGTSHVCVSIIQPVDSSEKCLDKSGLLNSFTGYTGKLGLALHKYFPTTLQNLAVNGSSLIDVINNQIPYIDKSATLITIYIGTNNIPILAKNSNTTSAITQWKKDYDRMLELIKERTPDAKIILLNIPNRYYLPNNGAAFLNADELKNTDQFSATSKLVNQWINLYSKKEIPVVDLTCDPSHYNGDQLPDGLHPNDKGALYLAEQIFNMITQNTLSTPNESCAPYL